MVGRFVMFSNKRGSFCEWVPTGYVKGPFIMGRSVMFSIREGPFVNGCLQVT
jgi:hypothetical protein